MAKTYKKLEAPVPKYLTNPSIRHANNKSKKQFVKKGNKALVFDSETGERMGRMGAMFLEGKPVNTKQFINFFAAGIEELMELSGAGVKIFRLIYSLILETSNVDFLTLDFKTLKTLQKWDYSQPTFNTGLNELLTKGIIFKSIAPAQYFVNVDLFYSGDRITLVKSFQHENGSQHSDLLSEIEKHMKEGNA